MIAKDLNSIDLGFDVIVIGAGAAGCAVAANLSKDLKVLVVDSKEFPRKKACSGIIVKEGKDYFGDKFNSSVLIDNKEIDIEYVDWDNNLAKISKKGFWNSDRFALDMFLFDPIRNGSNITFLQKTAFVDFTTTKDSKFKVVVLESNGYVKPVITRYVVGCDGALSRVRSIVSNRKIPFYIGVQEFIKTNKTIDHAYFIFDNSITDFYSWIIPKGNMVELGSLLNPNNSRDAYSLLKQKIAAKYGVVGDGQMNSAVVLRPASILDTCLGKESVFLCGEAAGLISPSSAEGISYALRSGKACAEAINSSKSPFKEYQNKLKGITGRLKEKFDKAKVLSSTKLRKKMFD